MSDARAEALAEVETAAKALWEARERLREARRALPPEPFADHALTGPDGEPVWLSALFGDKPDLIAVHNMGST